MFGLTKPERHACKSYMTYSNIDYETLTTAINDELVRLNTQKGLSGTDPIMQGLLLK